MLRTDEQKKKAEKRKIVTEHKEQLGKKQKSNRISLHLKSDNREQNESYDFAAAEKYLKEKEDYAQLMYEFFSESATHIKTIEIKFDEVIAEHAKKIRDEKTNKIDAWSNFRIAWRNSLIEKIKIFDPLLEKIKQEGEKLQIAAKDNMLLDHAMKKIHSGYHNSLGIILIFNDSLKQAEEHFIKSLQVDLGYVLPELWLAIIQFQLKKFPQSMEICNRAIKRYENERRMFNVHTVEHTSPLYWLLTELGDDTLDQQHLNFTHHYFCYSEFYYLRARNKKALELPFNDDFSIAYLLRGDNCFYNQQYLHAITNYQNAVTLKPKFAHTHFRLGITYFATGDWEQASQAFNTCIDLKPNDQDKAYYLSKMIELGEKAGDITRMRHFATQIQLFDCSPEVKMKAYGYLLKAAILSPLVSCWDEVHHYFNLIEKEFSKLDVSQKEKVQINFFEATERWLRFAHKTDKINLAYDELIKLYDKHLQKLEEDAKAYGSNKLQFPNWCYDRLYINFMCFFVTQFNTYQEMSPQINECFQKRIKYIQTVASGHGKILIRKASGADIALLTNLLELIKPITELNDSLTIVKMTISELEDIIRKQSTSLEQLYLEKSIPVLQNFPVNRCDDVEKSLLFHFEIPAEKCHHYFILRYVYLNRLAKASLLVGAGNHNPFIAVFKKTIIEIFTDLDKYKSLINQNQSLIGKRFQQAHANILEKKLRLLVLKTYLDWLEDKKVAIQDSSDLLLECTQLVTRINQLEKEKDHPFVSIEYFSISPETASFLPAEHIHLLTVNYDLMMERYRKQHDAILAQDPLSLKFQEEKNDYTLPLIVPFPYHILKPKFTQARKEHEIRNTANISVHGITFIFSKDEKQTPQKSTAVSFLPIDSQQDYLAFDTVNQQRQRQAEASIVERVRSGWNTINKQAGTERYSFFKKDASPQKTFNPLLHRHGEQNYFEYLRQIDIKELLNKLKRIHSGFTDKSTIQIIIHDMISDRTSCDYCKFAEVAEQESQGEYQSFAKRLQEYMITVHKQNTSIRIATRVCAAKKGETYSPPGQVAITHTPYTNPADRTLQAEGSTRLFECVEPTIAVSGSSTTFNFK